jgi:hypothetical protein
MRRLATLCLFAAGITSAAELTAVHNVYLLKMSKGFDQYLANHLVGGRVFQVVTDPKLADTIITEQIGESFQAKMDELFPPPEAVKPEPPPKPEKSEDAADPGMFTDTVNKLPAPTSAFSRAKGMVFLVDTKSKQVIWSAYGLPKDSSSKELDRTANDIVSRIKRDLKGK